MPAAVAESRKHGVVRLETTPPPPRTNERKSKLAINDRTFCDDRLFRSGRPFRIISLTLSSITADLTDSLTIRKHCLYTDLDRVKPDDVKMFSQLGEKFFLPFTERQSRNSSPRECCHWAHGAIAVPSVTRCRCRRGHRWAGGVRQYR